MNDDQDQYRGYRFPPGIIQHAIWLYVRFTLSCRDIEGLLAERGIMVSYETVRRWVNHFGPAIAADLRQRRPKPHTIRHLDEVYLRIGGRLVYLWRAVDAEGEVWNRQVVGIRVTEGAMRSGMNRGLMLPWQRRSPRPTRRMLIFELRESLWRCRDLGCGGKGWRFGRAPTRTVGLGPAT